jgi:pSer/pThr/pTyr-binding forkhead associated (FHA) protein
VCRFDYGASEPAAAAAWNLIVESDPALDDERDGDTPAERTSRVVPFVTLALLVGRRDEQRDIHPELPLDDPGASRRHLKLLRTPAGEVQLQDLASTNGTEVNGVAVPPGARRILREGDEVTLGRWTRIVLRAGS